MPFAGGGPVLGKFVKPSFTPGPSDNVLPFPNSVVSCVWFFFSCVCVCVCVFGGGWWRGLIFFWGGKGFAERRGADVWL